MISRTSWAEYVIKVTGTDNQSKIARMLDGKVPQSTVGRWLNGAEPKVRSVVLFADHFGLDYTEAFLKAAGKTAKAKPLPGKTAKPRRGQPSTGTKPQPKDSPGSR